MTEVHHTFSRYNRQYRTNSAFNGGEKTRKQTRRRNRDIIPILEREKGIKFS